MLDYFFLPDGLCKEGVLASTPLHGVSFNVQGCNFHSMLPCLSCHWFGALLGSLRRWYPDLVEWGVLLYMFPAQLLCLGMPQISLCVHFMLSHETTCPVVHSFTPHTVTCNQGDGCSVFFLCMFIVFSLFHPVGDEMGALGTM